jgi:hypothetical protein
MVNTFVEIYDLETPAKYKFEKQIELSGGRYSFGEKWDKGGIGLSGLMFHQKINEIQLLEDETDRHKVIFELTRKGLIVYMRNRMVNYGFLLLDSQISHFSIHKKNDLLTITDSSLVKKLLNFGVDYLTVRNLVLESDKVEFHDLYTSIHLNDGQKLNFEVVRFIPGKIFTFLTSKAKHKTEILVENYTVIPGKV